MKKNKQLNLMQTPYEILQLKQKEKRKIISQLKKQKSFSVRLNKNGQKFTQYHMEKGNPSIPLEKSQNFSLRTDQIKTPKPQKKYEILFRQSVRKVNAFRSKVYHTHAALNRQKLTNQYNSIERQCEPLALDDLLANESENCTNKTQQINLKPTSPLKKTQILNIGRYRIFFINTSSKDCQNSLIPEISGEKCTLNIIHQDHKQKIQKTIQSLYNHNKKMQNSIRKMSLEDTFTDRQNFSAQSHRMKTIDPLDFNTSSPKNSAFNSPKLTISAKVGTKNISTNQKSIQKINPKIDSIDQKKVANFIKSKKKKRFPISNLKNFQTDDCEFDHFKRTITDSSAFPHKTANIFEKIQERYYSPSKHRCGTRIKFNSIEENISGWQFQPFQNNQNLELLKYPLLQY